MSEGLLYKKAEANSYLPLDQHGEYSEDSVLELSMVRKIIAEAKAERAQIEEDFIKNLKYKRAPGVADAHFKHEAEKDAWYKKWFG